jgi:hypothetical protein
MFGDGTLIKSRPNWAGNRSAWVANAGPFAGVISVEVANFPLSVSVSSDGI